MARNEALNKKFQTTIIGKLIGDQTTTFLRAAIQLDDSIKEAQRMIEDEEPIVDIFTVPEEMDEINEILNSLLSCTAIKDTLKLINEPDPTETPI